MNPRTRRRRLARLGLAAALTLIAATACSSQDPDPRSGNAVTSVDADEFHGTLVDPPLTPAPVTLRDTDGNPYRMDAPTPDTATAVFFGFRSFAFLVAMVSSFRVRGGCVD